MNPPGSRRICLIPRLSGVGGMVSFQNKLAQGLSARGIEVSYDLADKPYQAVLVIGGTRNLAGLLQARREGIPIIQRLDGMNWLHRRQLPKTITGWRHFFRAEYGNLILTTIRHHLADRVIYQSDFVRRWWERAHGRVQTPAEIIYNGVDLALYSPYGKHQRPEDRWRILMVEGSLMGGYEQGLRVAVELVTRLASGFEDDRKLPVELMVVGRVDQAIRTQWDNYCNQVPQRVRPAIQWKGLVERQHIPEIDRSAHLLYSSDINAACPNSVIEALASGLPVLAFDTGALPELVSGDAGRVSPYGGDPWRLDAPDVTSLTHAAVEILRNQALFRDAARRRAEACFGLEMMVDRYLQVLLNG